MFVWWPDSSLFFFFKKRAPACNFNCAYVARDNKRWGGATGRGIAMSNDDTHLT